MHKGIFVLILGVATLAAKPGLAAQPNQSPNVSGPQLASEVRYVHLPDSKRQVAQLVKKLRMDADQANSTRAILEDRDHQISLVQSSEVLSDDAKNGRIAAISAGSNELIAAVLDSSQRQKFGTLLARQRGRKRANHERQADKGPSPLPTPDSAGFLAI